MDVQFFCATPQAHLVASAGNRTFYYTPRITYSKYPANMKRGPLRLEEYLKHILKAIDRIQTYFEEWLSDKPEQSARFLMPYPAEQLRVSTSTSLE